MSPINNNFKNNHHIKCIKGIKSNLVDNTLINELYILYKEYSNKSYTIYENLNINTFKKTFTNNAFTHFIIYRDNIIISYISMFKLDTLYNNTTLYTSGFLYYMFFKYDSLLINSFELISEHIYIHKIYDLITFGDIFNINYNDIKCIAGSSLSKYYLFNLKSSKIEAYKNALITI